MTIDLAADERLVIPWWFKGLVILFVSVIGAAMAFAVFQPIKVLPRLDLAPGYALTAQDGTTVNSESGRGTVTLYTFAPTDCSTCEDMDQTMRAVMERVPAEVELDETDFRLITIALDPIVDTASLEFAASRSGADGDTWRWLGGDPVEIETVVGAGFERYVETLDDGTIEFDPAFVLVDGNGVVRGEYRYQTLASDSDKLVDHIGVLAEEIRHAQGAAALAYEAAHLFLCYP